MGRGRSDEEILNDKSARFMNMIAKRASYYRANPQRFVAEYLGINLKLFQKILIWAMMHFDMFFFIAARGLGKTHLTSLYSVVRCILYPGTKIIACSATFKQGKEIILKITDEFMQKSPLLCSEISKVSVRVDDCTVRFKNGSWIRVVTATDTSRGARANVLIVDESRMVPQKIIDTVMRPMNSSPRYPRYLEKPEYAHLQEMNKEMYLSSAWYKASEMYEKVKAYTANMLDPSLKYFICDLPYQLSIKEGLLMREQIENEMSEATFSDITFQMEREGLFYGASEDALFEFDTLNNRRVLKDGLKPLEFYKDNNLRVPEKQHDEIRVLAVDVALMASRKHNNDASAFTLHCAVPTVANRYLDNISYIGTCEGLITDDLGLLIMRMFYQYDCDFLALDTNSIGMGVTDFLMTNRYDPMYEQYYPALDFVNNPEMSERCKVKGARKAIYSIKATAKFNHDACLNFRSAIQSGYLNLLINDQDCDEQLLKIRGYSKQTDTMKDRLRMPYVQTTMLINELVNLTHDITNGLIKVKERSGMRKDRYSSAVYGYYVVQEQNKNLKPRENYGKSLVNKLTMRAPSHGRRL